jgi:hypothetical protein
MRSIADDLKAKEREALASLTAAERVRLALQLGERDLEAFRLAHNPPLERAEAIRLLERRRQEGRRPSRCVQDMIG